MEIYSVSKELVSLNIYRVYPRSEESIEKLRVKGLSRNDLLGILLLTSKNLDVV
jgi:hypothetical protein